MGDIKLYKPIWKSVKEITGTTSAKEKLLQSLFEENLEQILGVRFLATEFRTNDGRIDTLGLDSKKRPVVIEYKRNMDEKIINQGVYYLDWIVDNKAEFKLEVLEKVGKNAAYSIDWSAPRLICVAADFSRFAANTVKRFNYNIELIRYRNFSDDLLMLEFLSEASRTKSTLTVKTPLQRRRVAREGNITVAVKAQKEHYEKLTSFLLSLGNDVQELHKKNYVAFKRDMVFSYVKQRNQKNKILVIIRVNPDEIDLNEGFSRRIRKESNSGCGVELTIDSTETLEWAKPLIRQSYEAS